LWLTQLGAEVVGVALPPCGDGPVPLFEALRIRSLVDHRCADLRSPTQFASAIADVDADLVIHMAAQSLVRPSYEHPIDTLLVNAIGTAHLLEACRAMPSLRGVIIVTSDKCYENQEWAWGYRETDALGGADPYSASKACAELITSSFRRSFFSGEQDPAIASVRAGNVIGGGDWARDRLVPDLIRAAMAGQTAQIRNPCSVRPWQHVLEPLAGYLELAALLLRDGQRWAGAWNFGPDAAGAATVGRIAREIARAWGDGLKLESSAPSDAPHEAGLLKLDSSKARAQLGWAPRLSVREACALTADWYQAARHGADMRTFTLRQIDHYVALRPEDEDAPEDLSTPHHQQEVVSCA
jgi:CDP-glucose 4,6-dehydratase